MTLLLLADVQTRIALITILVDLLGESMSELQIMIVGTKNAIFLACNKMFQRKVAESLLIEQSRPTLKVQEKSIELKLFDQFQYHWCIQNRCVRTSEIELQTVPVFAKAPFQMFAGALNILRVWCFDIICCVNHYSNVLFP